VVKVGMIYRRFFISVGTSRRNPIHKFELQRVMNKLFLCILSGLTFLLLINPLSEASGQVSADTLLIGNVIEPPDTLPGFRFGAIIESGPFWFYRNDVRIPGDEGTRFDMLDLLGTGVDAFIRINVLLGFNDLHHVRLLYAPLIKRGTGQFNEPVFFEETEFAAGIPTEGYYRFNTYRITYRFNFFRSLSWTLGAGAVLLIRDAEIALRQGELTDSSADLGFVPLLHFFAEGFVVQQLSFVLDLEGLVSPQGRAIEFATTVNWHPSPVWSFFAGYRFLEGGGDTDDVFNFAWINYMMGGVRFRLN